MKSVNRLILLICISFIQSAQSATDCNDLRCLVNAHMPEPSNTQLAAELESEAFAAWRLRQFKRGKPQAHIRDKLAEKLERVYEEVLTETQKPGLKFKVTPEEVKREVSERFHREAAQCSTPNTNCAARSVVWRPIDGVCNNPNDPYSGAAGAQMVRIAESSYADGLCRPRGRLAEDGLPSARAVSLALSQFNSRNQPSSPSTLHTAILLFFAQLVDHDMTRADEQTEDNGELRHCTCCDTEDYCFNIPVSSRDPILKEDCIPLVRTARALPKNCEPGPREQTSVITGFVDASMIYGSSEEELRVLRAKLRNGRLSELLNFTDNQNNGGELLPQGEQEMCRIDPARPQNICFRAGDERNTEQIGLAALHTIWLREHNRIARIIRNLGRGWGPERIFQETRRIMVAQWQHIVYNEYLPIVIGFGEFDKRNLRSTGNFEFNPRSDARIINSFATAAYRYGHSMVIDKYNIQDSITRTNPLPRSRILKLSSQFFRPEELYRFNGTGNIIQSLANTAAETVDPTFSRQITDHLFAQSPTVPGLDLISINIQRGRDHGLPTYNAFRLACNLGLVSNENAFKRKKNNVIKGAIRRLTKAYRNARDVDLLRNLELFPGGFLENPEKGGVLGETFACIVAKQFENAKFGDRFWYENRNIHPNSGRNILSFTPAQQRIIRSRSSLAGVICRNSEGVERISPYPLIQPRNNKNRGQFTVLNKELFRRGRNFRNTPIDCSNFPDLNIAQLLTQNSRG